MDQTSATTAIFTPVWETAPEQLVCPGDEIHIWLADLDRLYPVLSPLEALLSADEQERGQRFRFALHQQRFMAGRGILRLLLSQYLNVAPQALMFQYGAHGKPALAASHSLLQFNLSHADNLAVYAIGSAKAIGIDLEKFREVQVQDLAERFFSPQEAAALLRLKPELQQSTFFRYWTAKEALLKATGEGLSALSQVELDYSAAVLRLVSGPACPAADRWMLTEFVPASDYRAALAVAGQGWKLKFWRFVKAVR